ncbi:MAG: hypothetical protein AAGN46_11420, partial [Acidobacteriota bacterium]
LGVAPEAEAQFGGACIEVTLDRVITEEPCCSEEVSLDSISPRDLSIGATCDGQLETLVFDIEGDGCGIAGTCLTGGNSPITAVQLLAVCSAAMPEAKNNAPAFSNYNAGTQIGYDLSPVCNGGGAGTRCVSCVYNESRIREIIVEDPPPVAPPGETEFSFGAGWSDGFALREAPATAASLNRGATEDASGGYLELGIAVPVGRRTTVGAAASYAEPSSDLIDLGITSFDLVGRYYPFGREVGEGAFLRGSLGYAFLSPSPRDLEIPSAALGFDDLDDSLTIGAGLGWDIGLEKSLLRPELAARWYEGPGEVELRVGLSLVLQSSR